MPGHTFSFGKQLNKLTPLKPKISAFTALIERMDLPHLATVFQQFQEQVRTLLGAATDVEPLLNKLLESNSMWSVRLYVANLGRTPFLFNQSGVIHVEDETGAKYHEACHLVTLGKDDDGDTVRQKAETPLVLGSEHGVTFEMITSSVQAKMKRGDAFREAFTSASAKCWVEMEIQKVGIVRNKTLKTPKVAFKKSG